MLSNQLAKPIANCGAAVASVGGSRRELLRFFWGLRGLGQRTDLLDRADPDSISFAESAIDSASLGHAHFGAMNKERDIGRVGVAVTNESLACARFVDGSLERIPTIYRIGELYNRLNMNSPASLASS
jgi:hypothetical protein